MKENLVYITSHLPSYRVPQAGHKTARMILEVYAKQYNIYLFCFVNSEERNYLKKEDFSFCRAARFINISHFSRLLSILKHPFLPLNTAMRASLKLAYEIKILQRKISLQRSHFEFTASAYYMDFIEKECKKSVSEHDITYQAYERKVKISSGLKKLFYSFEYKRQKRWELKMLNKADEILVHNPKDLDLLMKDNISRNFIRIIDPYVNPFFKNVKRDRVENHTILFWGAMNRPENRDAVEWFVGDMFPDILKKYPDTKLNVVGANPPDKIKKLANSNIFISGFIENPLPYFETARLAVAPLRLGAGVKVKVLEALSAGVPVVATRIGGEGISHKNLFFADSTAEFIKLVLEKIK